MTLVQSLTYWRSNEYKRIGLNEVSTRHQLRRDEEQYELVEDFQKRHRSVYFPRFEEDPNIFEGLMFHWREVGDEDEREG